MLLELLDLVEDVMFYGSKPSFARMSRYWGYTETRAAYRAFELMQEQKYFEITQKGNKALFQIARKGKELLARRRPSPTLRQRAWDGRWRMVMFDFPEVARKARDAFRWTLRQQRMGCLQKSVWISPDPIIADWKKFLKEGNLSDWVLLFESAELGPVSDQEIAARVWQLNDLSKRYQQYVSSHGGLVRKLKNARFAALEGDLGAAVRRETNTYFELLREDPLLPRAVLPADFAGFAADALHAEVRNAVRLLIFEVKP